MSEGEGRTKMRTLLIPLCAMLLTACGSAEPPAAASATTGSNGPPFHPVTSVKELMNWVIDPNADMVWQSVGTIVTEAGKEEIQPVTDEQWATIRNSAVTVAEAGNLLMMKGRAFEEAAWMGYARAMTDTAMAAVQATEAKDKDALFDAGGALYESCTNCHSKYALGVGRDAQQ
jgi:hypothetical protein